jgi:hypothetical protein
MKPRIAFFVASAFALFWGPACGGRIVDESDGGPIRNDADADASLSTPQIYCDKRFGLVSSPNNGQNVSVCNRGQICGYVLGGMYACCIGNPDTNSDGFCLCDVIGASSCR